jgi:hypothetical protein
VTFGWGRVLTFMATVLDLVTSGKLVRLKPHLGPREQEDRIMYASPEFTEWLDSVLPGLGSDWAIETTPKDQFIELHASFALGECLDFGNHIKPLRPVSHGVWELKTPDLRVLGWFTAQDCFIAHRAQQATLTKRRDLYQGYIGEVVRFREALDLDEPKFLPGDDPRDVVSNFSF